MRGNTKIKSTGTTVAAEALSRIKHQTAAAKDLDGMDALIDGFIHDAIVLVNWENPTKIRDMIGIYLDGMSDDQITRFKRAVKKYVNG